jgi:hypothetical protein
MRSLFAGAAFGFIVIEADGGRLVLTFVGTDLRSIYAYALHTPPRANMRGTGAAGAGTEMSAGFPALISRAASIAARG